KKSQKNKIQLVEKLSKQTITQEAISELTNKSGEKENIFRPTSIKMTLLKKVVSCLVLIGCLLLTNGVRIDNFYGDVSLRSFLTNLCSELHLHDKIQLALVMEGNR